jgi:hypothetical protein
VIKKEVFIMVDDKEERAKAWIGYVKREVNAYLDSFLQNAKSGNIGVKYIHPIKSKSETGVKYDQDKAEGVKLMVVFHFEDEIDVPKEEQEAN